MPDGIAAENQRVIFLAHFIYFFIEKLDDLGACQGFVVKMPSISRDQRIHLEAPFAEQVEGGEIVLGQRVSPFADPAYVCEDIS